MTMTPRFGTYLAMAQNNRAFKDDIGRRAIIAIFALVGNQGEVGNRYRSLLSATQ